MVKKCSNSDTRTSGGTLAGELLVELQQEQAVTFEGTFAVIS